MIDTGSLNLLWSQALIAGFVSAGVTDAVISPGSRSTPLALAILRHPGLRVHIAIDERCAGFFALGIAKVKRLPVLMLATSGTAPANWLPAIIEASQTAIPLIAISADRPPEQQNCGANQTINQLNLFTTYVRASHAMGTPYDGFDSGYLHRLAAQVCEETFWPHPGPVHINQPFREPLVPADSSICYDTIPAIEHINIIPRQEVAARHLDSIVERISGRPGVIVCGEIPANPEFYAALSRLASRLACPILAEPLSGFRFGPHDRSNISVRYNRWLDSACAENMLPEAEWVIRFGAFPVTRNLQNYLANITETHVIIDPWPRWVDPIHRVSHLIRSDPCAVCDALSERVVHAASPSWLKIFAALEQDASTHSTSNHIAIVLEEIPNEAALFVGNSLAIRQLDSHSGHSNKIVHCYGNRGASGIDGNISTAAGIAMARGKTVALIGDLTCQHDIGGLALTKGLDIVIVVVNNGGGGIFDHLPQSRLPEFTQGWRTPQELSFAAAAETFGLGYQFAESHDSFRTALKLALQTGGPHLIELPEL